MEPSSEHVARTVGFGREFEFVAEVTSPVHGGYAVSRAYGHTEWGALMRARAAAAGRLIFRRRRSGFYPGGFDHLTPSTPASFRLGFA